MMQPNWFELALGTGMEKANVQEALALDSNTPRVVEAVESALKRHDENTKKN